MSNHKGSIHFRSKNWLKENLFNSHFNSFLTIVLLITIVKVSIPAFNWLFIDSVWSGDSQTCREASGACILFIKEKFLFILFGFYPKDLLWRPILCIFSFILLVIYSKEPKRWNRRTLYLWPIFFALVAIILRGNVFGLEYVESLKWGGLPLTLILSVVGIIFSYPIGILLSLGRRSKIPTLRFLCVGYIEVIRGVPMISLLFMSSVMFPLFLPEGVVIDKLIRAQVAIIMFISAYMAEVIRGGLQAIPKGQYEASISLGMNYPQTMCFVILPQALKIVIPPTVNTMIGMFKDTSLVLVIALFDLLGTTKSSLTDSNWLGFSIEAYIFVAIIYFIFCFSMGKYSRRLEVELMQGNH
jgi:general L-amino acid transport system permease protein